MLSCKLPWFHWMGTPGFDVASEGLAFLRPIFQHQWNKYARFSLRRVALISTSPASLERLDKSFDLLAKIGL